MKCRKRFTKEQFESLFSKTFIAHEWKKYREEMLYEREKNFFPATIPHVEYSIAKENLDAQIAALVQEKKRITKLITDLHQDSQNLKETILQSHKSTTRKCPRNKCTGFMCEVKNTKNLECGICHHTICRVCYEQVILDDENHVCDPDIIKNVEAIFAVAKPCPKCSFPTEKKEGCNQMWCVQCHTTWDWATGSVERGRIHNPHYYEYQRMVNNGVIPREEGDIPCGGLPSSSALQNHLASIPGLEKKDIDYVMDIYRAIVDYEHIERPQYQVEEYSQNTHMDLRIQHLRKKLTKEEFQKKLVSQERKREKKKNISEVMDTLIEVTRDLFIKIMGTKKIPRITRIIMRFDTLREYTNKQLANISEEYTCVVPIIDDYFAVGRKRLRTD